MDKDTEAALEKSIKHWEQNCYADFGFASVGSHNCALCDKFVRNREASQRCDGCPVAKRTGLTGCSGTPYYDASRAYYHAAESEFRKHAAEMVDFLKGLRPKKAEAPTNWMQLVVRLRKEHLHYGLHEAKRAAKAYFFRKRAEEEFGPDSVLTDVIHDQYPLSGSEISDIEEIMSPRD